MVLRVRGKPRIPVAFLVHDTEDASVRYRLGQFALPLLDHGIDLRIHPVPRSSRERLSLFRRLRRSQVVGIQRKLFGAGTFYLLRRMVRRLVYDFDDALYIRDSHDDSRPSWTRRGRFVRTVRLADRVIAGNRLLADAAREHSRSVEILPTTVDIERYPVPGRPRPKRSAVTIGWIGSRSTLFYLRELAPALERVPGRGLPSVRLKVIADSFFELDGVDVIKKVWREAEEVNDLRDIDIGIMPLRDDAWSEGKCGLKLLQYMALEIPVVCTPVGTNLDMVSDGVEGIHARTAEEWIRALRRLAAEPGLRRSMGKKAREKVVSSYSSARALPRLASILQAASR